MVMRNKKKKESSAGHYCFIMHLFLMIMTAAGLAACETGEAVLNQTDEKSEIAVDKSHTNNDEKYLAAVEFYYEGNIEESIEIFKEICVNEPENLKAGLSLIRLLQESGRYSEALSYSLLCQENGGTRVDYNFPEGSLWEDPFLSYFLSGDYAEYLEKTVNSANNDFLQETGSLANDIKAEKLFFSGWAFADSGDADKGISYLNSAIEKRSYFPTAYLLLGFLDFKNSDFASAENNLTKALKLDSNLTQGRVILAKSIIEQKRLSEGDEALRRAVSIRPWDRDTALYLSEFEKSNPVLYEKREQAEKKRRILSEVPEISVFTAEPEIMPWIRVGLAEKLKQFYIKPGGRFGVSGSDGKVLFESESIQILRIVSGGRNVEIYSEDGEELLKLPGPVSIKCSSPDSAILVFNVQHSSGYSSAGQEDRSYRGGISVLNSPAEGITVINTLPLEEYLYSVVPSEMPSYWPEEALCAQAIAARSYTLAHMGRFGKKGFDVSGSVSSAFYRGLTGENEKTTKAVEKTRGLVLRYEGKYLSAFYSANSAGRTESAESVWGGTSPLIGVTDPQLVFESEPPAPYELARWILSEPQTYSSVPEYSFRSSYRWRLIVPREEIEERTGGSIGDIISITTRGRGMSGRVEEVLIKGTSGEKVIRGDSIRRSLGGLRSNLFIIMPKYPGITNYNTADIEASLPEHQPGRHPWLADIEASLPEFFIFAGAGWGHGVGMCQTGAAGMAEKGFSAEEILKHYYPLAQLKREY